MRSLVLWLLHHGNRGRGGLRRAVDRHRRRRHDQHRHLQHEQRRRRGRGPLLLVERLVLVVERRLVEQREQLVRRGRRGRGHVEQQLRRRRQPRARRLPRRCRLPRRRVCGGDGGRVPRLRHAAEKATLCASTLGLDQCCDSVPCPNGEPCLVGPLVPICAGVPIRTTTSVPPTSAPRTPTARRARSAARGRARASRSRACLGAGCKLDADCAAAPGGVCAPSPGALLQHRGWPLLRVPERRLSLQRRLPIGRVLPRSSPTARAAPGAPVCPQ